MARAHKSEWQIEAIDNLLMAGNSPAAGAPLAEVRKRRVAAVRHPWRYAIPAPTLVTERQLKPVCSPKAEDGSGEPARPCPTRPNVQIG